MVDQASMCTRFLPHSVWTSFTGKCWYWSMKTKKIEKIVEKICSGQSVRWTAVKPRASQCAAVMASSTPTGVLDSFFWTQAFIFPIIKFITNHVLIPLNFPPRPGLNSPPPHTHSPMTRCLVPSAYDYLHYVYFSVVSIAWIWWSIQRSKYQWQRSSSWPGKGCPFLKCVASIWVLTVREAGGEGGAMLIKNQHISKRGFPN